MVLVKPPAAPPPPPPEDKPPHAEPDLSKYPRNDMYVTTAATRTVATGAALAYLLVSHWGFKTIFHTIFTRPTHWFGRLFSHFVPSPAKLERQLEQDIGHYMSNLFVSNSPHVARWLHEQADVVEQATGVIMAEAEWTYQALRQLRWTTVPTLIYRATLPLANAINGLDTRVTSVENKIADATGYINNGLRQLPWGTGATFPLAIRQWVGSYVHLWTQFYRFLNTTWQNFLQTEWQPLKARVTYVWDDLYHKGRNGIEGIRARLGTLELEVGKIVTSPLAWIVAALGTAAGIAALAQLLRRAAPNLTCNETTDFTSDLCTQAAGTGHNWARLLEELLGLALGTLILVDPNEVADWSGKVLDVLDPGVAWMADMTQESFAQAEADVAGAVAGFLGL